MLKTLMATDHGGRFVDFMRSPQGKALDKFLVRNMNFALLMRVFFGAGWVSAHAGSTFVHDREDKRGAA